MSSFHEDINIKGSLSLGDGATSYGLPASAGALEDGKFFKYDDTSGNVIFEAPTYLGLSDTPASFTNGSFITMSGSALVHTDPATYSLSNFLDDLPNKGIYDGSGSLSGDTIVTQSTNQITFDSTTPTNPSVVINRNGSGSEALNVKKSGAGSTMIVSPLTADANGLIISSGFLTPDIFKISTSAGTYYDTGVNVAGGNIPTNTFGASNQYNLVSAIGNGRAVGSNRFTNLVVWSAAEGGNTQLDFGWETVNNDAIIKANTGIQVVLGTRPFNILGNTQIDGTIKIVDGSQQNGYVLTSDATGLASWQPASVAAGTGGIYSGSGSLSGSTTVTMGANDLTFSTNGNANTIFVDGGLGRVGFGTNSPLSFADFNGGVRIRDSFGLLVNSINPTSGNVIDFTQNAAGTSAIFKVVNTSTAGISRFQLEGDGSSILSLRNHNAGSSQYAGDNALISTNKDLINSIAGSSLNYKIRTDNANLTAPIDRMTMNSSGEFGFGSLAPLAGVKVYIQGNTQIDGTIKIVDGSQANGYVLTSDATGLASWQPAGGTDTNFANTDLTFSVDRTHDISTNQLNINAGASNVFFLKRK